MTIKDLKKIIQSIPEETIVLLSAEDIYDVESCTFEKSTDGLAHFILNAEE